MSSGTANNMFVRHLCKPILTFGHTAAASQRRAVASMWNSKGGVYFCETWKKDTLTSICDLIFTVYSKEPIKRFVLFLKFISLHKSHTLGRDLCRCCFQPERAIRLVRSRFFIFPHPWSDTWDTEMWRTLKCSFLYGNIFFLLFIQ